MFIWMLMSRLSDADLFFFWVGLALTTGLVHFHAISKWHEEVRSEKGRIALSAAAGLITLGLAFAFREIVEPRSPGLLNHPRAAPTQQKPKAREIIRPLTYTINGPVPEVQRQGRSFYIFSFALRSSAFFYFL